MVRCLLVLLVLAGPAHANVGKCWGEGTRTLEPGGLHEIAIEREDLRFDMRPVATGASGARVSATYFLDNRGTTTVTAPLVFVAGSGIANLDVVFDRARMNSHSLGPSQVAALPAAWEVKPANRLGGSASDPATPRSDRSRAGCVARDCSDAMSRSCPPAGAARAT